MTTLACTVCGSEYPRTASACPTCGMAPSAQERALPMGTELHDGKFAIGRVLGEGGFGITYKGAHTNLQRPVAIKELFPEGAMRLGTNVAVPSSRQADFKRELDSILQEARLIASLSSPHIVDVHDMFTENGTVYIVMEYLEGQTLQARIDALGPIAPDVVARVALEACNALAVVHDNNLLHRDVKPANIVLTQDGRTVLIDFGAAREYQLSQTGRHTRILTEDYAALEQYSTTARFGPYTDIYGLGATLFHALTGTPPPRALDRMQDPGLTLAFPRDVPDALHSAIRAALHLKVQERPQRVAEFRKILESDKPPAASAPAPSVSPTAASTSRDRGRKPPAASASRDRGRKPPSASASRDRGRKPPSASISRDRGRKLPPTPTENTPPPETEEESSDSGCNGCTCLLLIVGFIVFLIFRLS